MPRFGKKFKFFYLLIVSFFGTGLISKKMPGTVGSLFATALAFLMPRNSFLLFVLASITFLIGSLSSDIYVKKYDNTSKDPGYIVIDEACGIFLGLSIIYYFGYNLDIFVFFNFLFFRFFDILKPFGIKRVENLSKHAGFNIMLDDVLAAVYGSVLGVFVYRLWERLNF